MKQGVIGIIKAREENLIILVKRRDVPIWVLPGGGIDQDETPEHAIIREIREETGLTVKIKRKVGEYTPINKLATLTHVYECEQVNGTMQLTDETRGIGAFPLDALPPSFFFVHSRWLDDAEQNLPHPFKKKLSEITYWGVIKFFMRHPILVFRALLARLGIPFNTC